MTKRIWLAALALAGCEQTEVKETTQPPVAAVSAREAEPGAVPEPASAPVLTAEGYGLLRIGMSRAEVEAALGADANPASVGGPEPESCDQFRPARAPEGLLAMVEDGRLTRLSLIREAKVKTVHGLGLGAAAADVRAQLGARGHAEPHKYQDPPAEYLTWWASAKPPTDRPPASDRTVEHPDARGIRYEIGQDGKVQAIHAGGPSIQYVEGCL